MQPLPGDPVPNTSTFPLNGDNAQYNYKDYAQPQRNVNYQVVYEVEAFLVENFPNAGVPQLALVDFSTNMDPSIGPPAETISSWWPDENGTTNLQDLVRFMIKNCVSPSTPGFGCLLMKMSDWPITIVNGGYFFVGDYMPRIDAWFATHNRG
jgi:hypothetical protein